MVGNIRRHETLNCTEIAFGTARTHGTASAHMVETLGVSDEPTARHYEEIYTLASLTISMASFSFSDDYDGTTATPACNSTPTASNLTINVSATNATLAARP